MIKSYQDPELDSQLVLTDDQEKKRQHRDEEYFKVLWNRGIPFNFKLDGQQITLERNQLICLTPLQKLEFSDLAGEYYLLLFNREFYCIHNLFDKF